MKSTFLSLISALLLRVNERQVCAATDWRFTGQLQRASRLTRAALRWSDGWPPITACSRTQPNSETRQR